ncbi:DUF1800 family protein [Pseudoruegeria sp. SK021]|uniref:DUF1800 domain-containing protein n=1 Tax=Pseudoruegeria sp. SK021 TaxID=1933035 RepID=UPI000A228F39|nr:DUF1800 domain-containing protein [Pseudoruegeria sp. SK021]OSP56491.1 hypothetical protein BV911_00570 [Pseudoruegeria sp. SK021]
MTAFDPILADIRFGCGLRPSGPDYDSARQMLRRLSGPDRMAARFVIPTFDAYRLHLLEAGQIGSASLPDDPAGRLAAGRVLRNAVKADQTEWFRARLQRRLQTSDGFRERLVSFWADHFTAIGSGNFLVGMNTPYVEESIRPHVTGSFHTMLAAVTRAPMMLSYLDQHRSFGPNSPAAAASTRPTGLNENLAREMLELHTLGVTGPYTQTDVRQLAELLTGLRFNVETGFRFAPQIAEPGPEIVLGTGYGGDAARIEDIDAALIDLARHPATAQHLSRKLAVHFLGDQPDETLITAMTARYMDTDGNLPAVYEVLLSHPSAWDPAPGNIKQPIDFIASSLRALGGTAAHLAVLDPKTVNRALLYPLSRMGQVWETPTGPDGWPEEDAAWITPLRLAARVDWSMTVPARIFRPLPDPRGLLDTALSGRAPKSLIFAVSAAEDRPSGVGVLLSSPAFQRM